MYIGIGTVVVILIIVLIVLAPAPITDPGNGPAGHRQSDALPNKLGPRRTGRSGGRAIPVWGTRPSRRAWIADPDRHSGPGIRESRR